MIRKPIENILVTTISSTAERSASSLLELVYSRLRRLATTLLITETSHTLPPTALVHEAYLRLAEGERFVWNGKTHFYRVAARQMRRILIDRGRKRQAQKRMPALLPPVRLAMQSSIECLELHQALEELSSLSPRQAQVFNLHCREGFTFPQVAHALSISERTAKNDWTVARAWLARYLRPAAAVASKQGHVQNKTRENLKTLS